jgi:hypothetical protein
LAANLAPETVPFKFILIVLVRALNKKTSSFFIFYLLVYFARRIDPRGTQYMRTGRVGYSQTCLLLHGLGVYIFGM